MISFQAYDEPRLSNEVIPGVLQVADETSQEVITTDEVETSSVQIDTTTKVPALDDAPTARPGHKKRKPTDAVVPVSGFSRVIDDIFNVSTANFDPTICINYNGDVLQRAWFESP